MTETADETDRLDLGATDGTLRLWCAREAQRQHQCMVQRRLTNVEELRGRATSVMGWSVAGLLAAIASSAALPLMIVIAPAAICVAIAVAFCLRVLSPTEFSDGVWSQKWLLSEPYPSELQIIETMIRGAEDTAARDSARQGWMALQLKYAYRAIAAAPIAALFGLEVSLLFHCLH